MIWYTGNIIYDTVLLIAFCFVLITIIAAFFMESPYGRFGNMKIGINLSPRTGWFLMELPATLSFLYFYFSGINRFNPVPLVFLVVWLIHYGNRGFVFPYLIRIPKGSKKNFNILVVLIGIIVTTIHGYLNGSFISGFGNHFTASWLSDPRFILGILLYYTGFILNIHSDRIIRNLRSPDGIVGIGESRYKIPFGGGFRFVTSPHYLGELIAWTGFAVATWSFAGLFILSISAANLLPRAFSTHKWYKEAFENYPKDRKVLIPFIL